ncbi:MAG: hypothetical protein ACR2PG_11805, partial [Hyphomicrobiaceae bacterium]
PPYSLKHNHHAYKWFNDQDRCAYLCRELSTDLSESVDRRGALRKQQLVQHLTAISGFDEINDLAGADGIHATIVEEMHLPTKFFVILADLKLIANERL